MPATSSTIQLQEIPTWISTPERSERLTPRPEAEPSQGSSASSSDLRRKIPVPITSGTGIFPRISTNFGIRQQPQRHRGTEGLGQISFPLTSVDFSRCRIYSTLRRGTPYEGFKRNPAAVHGSFRRRGAGRNTCARNPVGQNAG